MDPIRRINEYKVSFIVQIDSKLNQLITDSDIPKDHNIKEQVDRVLSEEKLINFLNINNSFQDKIAALLLLSEIIKDTEFAIGDERCHDIQGGSIVAFLDHNIYNSRNQKNYFCHYFFHKLNFLETFFDKKEKAMSFAYSLILHEVLHLFGLKHNTREQGIEMFQFHSDLSQIIDFTNHYQELDHSHTSQEHKNDIKNTNQEIQIELDNKTLETSKVLHTARENKNAFNCYFPSIDKKEKSEDIIPSR